jgi:uncharacterized protein YbjT (DUF2867 family)
MSRVCIAKIRRKCNLGLVQGRHPADVGLVNWHDLMEVSMNKTPTVLLIGVTGQLGNLIAQNLRKDKSITLRVCARDDNKLSKLRSEFEQAVKLDLDDPSTFQAALEGVDRAFLLTGYTFAMVTQSKTFVDAARKASIKHLVHLGVFTPELIAQIRTLPGTK